MSDLNMSVKEASELIGKSQTFIREGLARGLLPFGTGFAIKEGGKKRTFCISRKLFYEYYGIEEDVKLDDNEEKTNQVYK